nr:hypothetical protein [Pelobacter seleniigenes]
MSEAINTSFATNQTEEPPIAIFVTRSRGKNAWGKALFPLLQKQ